MRTNTTTVNRKVRSDASWNALSKEQRETLEAWLFEDNLSYEQAWERAKTELGFSGSLSALKRFGRWCRQARWLVELREGDEAAAAVCEGAGDEKVLRKATLRVLKQQLFERVREERSLDLVKLAAVVAQAEKVELAQKRLEVQRLALFLKQTQFLDMMRQREGKAEASQAAAGKLLEMLKLPDQPGEGADWAAIAQIWSAKAA